MFLIQAGEVDAGFGYQRSEAGDEIQRPRKIQPVDYRRITGALRESGCA